jgi:hypothetical protein
MELEYPRKNKATKPGSNDGNGKRRLGRHSNLEEQANFQYTVPNVERFEEYIFIHNCRNLPADVDWIVQYSALAGKKCRCCSTSTLKLKFMFVPEASSFNHGASALEAPTL